jgi:hypothetical protein
VEATTNNGRPGAWICVLGLFICLMGCQPRPYQAPPPPPPPPLPAPPPRVARPTFYVAINQLNLRSCPGIDCPKISALELNAEVEKMGEVGKWTQVRVKKDGMMGYVSSRYLSPTPVEVAPPTKKKPKTKAKKATPPKATQPPKPTEAEGEAPPKKPLSPGEETKPGGGKPVPATQPEGQKIPKVM